MGSRFRRGDGFHCCILEERKTDKLHNVAEVGRGRGERKERHYHILRCCGRDRLGRGCKQKIKDLKMCVFESVQSRAFLHARKRGKRAKMRELIEWEVGLHCFKSGKRCHGNKEACFRAICKKMVVQLFE